MNKDETLEALTQEIWGELPFGRWWSDATEAQQKDAVAETLRKSATLAALLTDKSAIPSGQVADDVDQIHQVVRRAGGPPLCNDGCTCATHTALSRLATQAQSAESYRGMWIDAERGRNALLAERDRLKEAGTALMRESNNRLDRAERAETRVAELERQVLEEGGKFLQEQARADRLSAAGQVLSEHVDKATECAGEPDCGWHNGGPCKACKRATGWTLRDEFALVAMHTVTVACKAELDDGRLSFRNIAKRSYGIADEMLKAREAK